MCNLCLWCLLFIEDQNVLHWKPQQFVLLAPQYNWSVFVLFLCLRRYIIQSRGVLPFWTWELLQWYRVIWRATSLLHSPDITNFHNNYHQRLNKVGFNWILEAAQWFALLFFFFRTGPRGATHVVLLGAAVACARGYHVGDPWSKVSAVSLEYCNKLPKTLACFEI